jgi:hypothetical protein
MGCYECNGDFSLVNPQSNYSVKGGTSVLSASLPLRFIPAMNLAFDDPWSTHHASATAALGEMGMCPVRENRRRG